ncbi:tyrosine-type recombinase/integrase [Lysinibacillus xylanilyticus]|uniref:tyrosine-type recombinase/integrase n=1 Tax=Lysinibacillus xylanilyticus TaxID=582475 RepID=UPI0037FEBF3F
MNPRHTFASYLLTKGVNIKVIQEQLGHATIQETLITYSHVGQDQKKSATELFNFINKKTSTGSHLSSHPLRIKNLINF